MTLRLSEKQFAALTGARRKSRRRPAAFVALGWRKNAFALTLPLRVESEANRREHWAAKHRRTKAQRRHVAEAWLAAYGARRPTLPCVVTLTRLGGQPLDQEDNLNIAFKGVRDELAAILGVNDRDPRVRWQYRQAPGGAVGIQIEAEFRPLGT